MVNLGLFSGAKRAKSVNVRFRLPYYTHWGQSLVVCGSDSLVGSWNVKKGLLLSPVHQGDQLIWCGSIAVSNGFECEYNYYVVDDNRNVLRWEKGNRRKVLLPQGLQGGEVIELRDLWQVLSFTFYSTLLILFTIVSISLIFQLVEFYRRLLYGFGLIWFLNIV